jgi:DNA polymerase
VLDRVVRYCVSDVEIMQHGWPLLAEWVDLEAEISRVDRIVNDRGIRFDVPLARRLLEEDARNATIALEAEARNLRRYGVTMGADRLREIVASPQQFGEWSGLENAQKETVERVLVNAALYPDEDDIQFAAIFCRARQAIASIARGKLEAGLARVSKDGRLRDSHRYYGAHTGRWSGRGMQLQNMPRPEKRFEEYTDEDICALAEYVMAGGHVDAGEIDLLLRACLFARPRHKLLVSDFSGVEARGNAWAAGDSNAIDVFLSGKDAYKVMAAKIFGIDLDDVDKIRRQVGKIAELACGYGMGGEKFGWTAAKNGANLEALGIDPYEVVTAWRTQHRPIVQLWYALERGMLKAVSGEENTVADLFTFTPSSDGSDVAMFLPSGRPIVYNAPRVSRGRNNRPRISYHGHKGRQDVYGGLLCENAIQGLSRCLMARALVMAEDAGLDPVLHVHDEIVCEVPEQGAEEAGELLHAIMCDLPEWATGFPIGADGHEGERYRK